MLKKPNMDKPHRCPECHAVICYSRNGRNDDPFWLLKPIKHCPVCDTKVLFPGIAKVFTVLHVKMRSGLKIFST